MKISVEELMGKEVKMAILETFQEFLLSKENSKSSEPVQKSSSVKSAKSAKSAKKVKTGESEKSPKKKRSKDLKSPIKTMKSSEPVSSGKTAQIEKLKSYVYKCGVRKVWKKELEGLNENESIRKIQEILKELGIEGKPSLEQCKAIKERREFEAELREIDTSNIIEGKRRRDSFIDKKKFIESESDGTDESDNLKAFGDSESE